MNKLQQILDAARESNAVNDYAMACVCGDRSWSGSDLQGLAKKYGGGYWRARDRARKVVEAAGGCIIPVERGRLVTAALYRTAGDGTKYYQTTAGKRRLRPGASRAEVLS